MNNSKHPPVGPELNQLIREQAEWSQRVFGSDKDRGPIGPLKHLEKEVRETIQAIEQGEPRGQIQEEFADQLIIFLDASRRAGFTFQELVDCALQKMVKNRARQWQTPTKPDEPIEHVRD